MVSQVIVKLALERLLILVIVVHASEKHSHTLGRPICHGGATTDARRVPYFLTLLPLDLGVVGIESEEPRIVERDTLCALARVFLTVPTCLPIVRGERRAAKKRAR
jgi:hypothetical protein